ncbi:MAG: hypothetical protein D6818_01330, partial [Bacteroidetes bacterium]
FYVDTPVVAGIIWPLDEPERWAGAALRYAGFDEHAIAGFSWPTRAGQFEQMTNDSTGRIVACWPNHGGIFWVLAKDGSEALGPVFETPARTLQDVASFRKMDRDFAPHLALWVNRQISSTDMSDQLPERARWMVQVLEVLQKQFGTMNEGLTQVIGMRSEPGRIRSRWYFDYPPGSPVLRLTEIATRPEAGKRMWCHVPGQQPALFVHFRMDLAGYGAALEQMMVERAAEQDPKTRMLYELADLFINEEVFKELWGGAFTLSIDGTIPVRDEVEVTTYDDNFNEIVTTQTVEKQWPRMVMAWDYGNEDTWLRLLRILDGKGRLQPDGKAWRLDLAGLPMPIYLYFRKGIAVCTNDAQLAHRRKLPRKQRLNGQLRAEVARNDFFFRLDLPQTFDLAGKIAGGDLGMITDIVPVQYLQGRAPLNTRQMFEQEMILTDDRTDGLNTLLKMMDALIGPTLSNLGGFKKS